MHTAKTEKTSFEQWLMHRDQRIACTTDRYAMFTTSDKNECRNLRRQLKLIPQGGHDFSSHFTETSFAFILGKSMFRRKRRVISRLTGKKNEKHRNCITRVNLVILMTFRRSLQHCTLEKYIYSCVT